MNLFDYKNNENSKEKKLDFESYKDLLMYYNTTIRNVALTTGVSFAALGYSRFYRGKIKIYSIGLVLVSLMLLICSSLINYLLFNNIEKYKNLPKYTEINNWRNVNIIFMFIHIITITFSLYTLFRLVTNTSNKY
jgi:hypothetical protein